MIIQCNYVRYCKESIDNERMVHGEQHYWHDHEGSHFSHIGCKEAVSSASFPQFGTVETNDGGNFSFRS